MFVLGTHFIRVLMRTTLAVLRRHQPAVRVPFIPAAWGALVIGLLTLPACSAFTSDEPPISDSTMVEVLIELHLTNARLELEYDRLPALRDSILFTYGLDAQRFADIMAYYAEHPEAYAALYATMLDRISAERIRQGEALPVTERPLPDADEE